MDKVLVSIGIPVYNGAEWIENTLDSILNQTYSNIEIIISDNASTDNTEASCRDYAAKDNRVRYFRNDQNIGVSNNYNSVFNHSSGDFFKWSSASDIIKPDFIEKCLEKFNADPELVLVCPGTVLFNEETGSEEEYVENINLTSHSAVDRFINYVDHIRLNNVMNGLIKSAALKKTGLMKNFLGADINMIAELSLYGRFKLLPQYLFYRRMEQQTATFYKPVEEVLKYFNPDNKNLMLFQYWINYLYYLKVVKKSLLKPSEKLLLKKFILKTMYYHKSLLWNDFKYSLKCLPSVLMKKWSNA